MRRIGLSGERLRDARLLRGLTGTALAERVGVSSGAISQYESGGTEPRPVILARLADALQVTERYLLSTPPPADESPYLFRSQAAASRRAREVSKVRLRWLGEIAAFVERRVELPSQDLPEIPIGDNPESIRDTDVDAAASEVRRHWGLGTGPIANLAALLEAKGVILGAFSFNGDGQDSVSKRERSRCFAAVNSDAVTRVRARFDLAHELGHLVLHRSVPPITASSPLIHKLMEKQAHQFAAGFLIPEPRFRDEVYSLSIPALLSLKRRWGTSIQMLQRYARRLDLISDSQYQKACMDIARRGFKKNEPLDEESAVEPVELLRRAVELMSDHAPERRAVIDTLALPEQDVELIVGLPAGYFAGSDARVVPLHLRERPQEGEASSHAVGEVLPFQRRP